MHWRFLLTSPLPGPLNMGVDHALLARARASGEGVVRIYEWSVPTISFGRNQSALGQYDPDLARNAGLGLVRRQTGGRAVLHHREITYAVAAACDGNSGLRAQYNAINEALVLALRAMDVDAEIVVRTERMPKPGGSPCFEVPAPGEIAVGGAKLVGSAQIRIDGAFLQHGSILVHNDQGLLAQAALRPVPPLPRVATLADTMEREPSSAEVAEALFTVVARTWDHSAAPLNEEETHALMLAAHDAAQIYRAQEWTWRR